MAINSCIHLTLVYILYLVYFCQYPWTVDLSWCQRSLTFLMIPLHRRTLVWWRLGSGTTERGATGLLEMVESGEMEGTTSIFMDLHLRPQRALWLEDREPGASSGERGPTPAPHPAQPPPPTSDVKDLSRMTMSINVGYTLNLYQAYFIMILFSFPRSPVLRHQAMLARSCSQLEAIGGATSQQCSSVPEIRVRPCTPLHLGAGPVCSVPLNSSSSAASGQTGGNGPSLPHQLLYLRQWPGKSEKDGESVKKGREGFPYLVRSHSEPGLGSSTDTGDSDVSMKHLLVSFPPPNCGSLFCSGLWLWKQQGIHRHR